MFCKSVACGLGVDRVGIVLDMRCLAAVSHVRHHLPMPKRSRRSARTLQHTTEPDQFLGGDADKLATFRRDLICLRQRAEKRKSIEVMTTDATNGFKSFLERREFDGLTSCPSLFGASQRSVVL